MAPRTPTQIARELHIVLEALAVEGPIVLIGHSMGGLHVLRYGSLFPDRVVAVVILDAPPPGFEDERLALLTPVEREERRRILAQGMANAPATVRLEREGAADNAEWDLSGFPRAIPLIVVAADSQEFGDLGNPAEHRRLWVATSRQWLDLSDLAEFVVAEGSGHMVHHDRQVLVTSLVKCLLNRRGGADLAEPQPNTGRHLSVLPVPCGT